MKRSKESYINYVCTNCFNTLDECTCRIFPPYNLVFIDRNIQKHIRTLNNKGYITLGCCESHYEEVCVSIYICFAREYDFKEMPMGFKYNKNKRMVYYNYSKNLTREETDIVKETMLKVLLEWCKKLESL